MISEIRQIVRGTYDLQKLRISTGNRVSAQFRAKIGIDPGESEAKAEREAQKLLTELRREYKRITDGITKLKNVEFEHDGLISGPSEFALVRQYIDLLDTEESHFSYLHTILSDYPLYTDYLLPIRGVREAISGVLISEIDIHKARYVSSLWRYAGLDVGGDGRGRSRKKEHLVDQSYLDKNGEEQTKQGITFNPFLKTKLMGVLAPNLIRQNEHYRKIYQDYKHRLECRPDLAETTKGHRAKMAERYMIKWFLADLYNHWRALEGLPIHDPYNTAKLDLTHSTTPEPA